MWRRSFRLIIVLLISLLTALLTQYWYDQTAFKDSKGAGSALAFVQQRTNIVEQKLVDRLIWKKTQEGELLFRGDTIRTSRNSNVEIVFPDSKTSFLLNEESQVVIDILNGELSLNLLRGSVIAKGPAFGPKLITKQQVIKLTGDKSELLVEVDSKNRTKGCVYKGAMKLEDQRNKDSKIVEEGNCNETAILPILSPRANEVLGADKGRNLVEFEFIYPNTPFEAALYLGDSKDRMQKVETIQSNVSKAKIITRPPAGPFYWQIIARSKRTKAESLLQKSIFIDLERPGLVSPQDKHQFVTRKSEFAVPLRWSSPKGVRGFKLQVSKNPRFKPVFYEKEVRKSFHKVRLPRGEKYYWRVLAFWNEKVKSLASDSRAFSVLRTKNLPTPRIIRPSSLSTVPLVRNGNLFEWRPVEDAQAYSLRLFEKNGGVKIYHTESPSARIKLSLGSYKWNVRAINADVLSKASQTAEFRTIPPQVTFPRILGLENGMLRGVEFRDFRVNWRGVKGASAYLLSMTDSEGREKSSETRRDGFNFGKLRSGVYGLRLKSRDSFGKLSEASPVYRVLIEKEGGAPPPNIYKVIIH